MKSRIPTYWILLRYVLAVTPLVSGVDSFAQQHPERRHIRSGNRQYESGNYSEAEEKYRTAIQSNPLSFEAAFNLADALYKQGKFEEAVELLERTAQAPLLTPEQKAQVYHNLGNGMFSQQKLKEAEEFYKQSLRENPADLETKYNLAYVQKLLEEDNQNGDGSEGDSGGGSGQNRNDSPGSGNNEGNDDRQQSDPQGEEQNDDRQQNSDEEQSKDNGNNPEENDRKEQTDSQDTRPEGDGIKKEDAESILDAMQQQEDKTRDKVNEQRAATVGRSGKNW